jgi:hypothetical protein
MDSRELDIAGSDGAWVLAQAVMPYAKFGEFQAV